MQPRRILLTAGVCAFAAAVAPVAGAKGSLPGMHASKMPAQHLTIVVHPASAAPHGEHVTIPNFAVEPGLPVQITVLNYTRDIHTFTVPGLRLSKLIQPAHGGTPTATVLTFTAPKLGVFDWVCMVCADKGASGGEMMRGRIYAIIQV